ncbi:MAG: LysR substrate-binding domain-containing protein [Cyanobium sp.]
MQAGVRGLLELRVLEALDALQWLRTGAAVAERYGISQSTVARCCGRALQVLGLELERRDGEWELVGDLTILQLERRVHQLARWRGHRPLRLEATYWSATTFCDPCPAGWILGASDIVGIGRNLQLLRQRVIDVWVAGLPDVPPAADPDLEVLVLSDMPVFFTCAPGHPLLGRPQIDLEAVAAFPTLALPGGAYPQVEEALQRLGLWNDSVRMARYRRDRWEGRSEEQLTIGYGTPLSMAVSGGALQRLPLLLPFRSGDALVVHREFRHHPAFRALATRLADALAALAVLHPEITLV